MATKSYPGDRAIVEAAARSIHAAVDPDDVLTLGPFRDLAAMASNLRTGAYRPTKPMMAQLSYKLVVLATATLAARRIVGDLRDEHGLPGLRTNGDPA